MRKSIDLRLLALWESPAMGEVYGESISVRDHLLQSAELATRLDLPAPLIAAALLHDIGWAMTSSLQHEAVAADWLEPLFGPKVSEPVRWHVAAKRYLVARDADYTTKLSAESLRTLAIQGGQMDAREQAEFEMNSGFDSAIRLRMIDDAAKVRRSPATGFDDYLTLLASLSAVPNE